MRSLLVLALLVLAPLDAMADRWDTPDKPAHAMYSGLLVGATYAVIEDEHAAEIAFITTMAIGWAKEKYGPNPYFSRKDMGANLIGAGVAYIGIKLGEKYGFNPFYFEFN